VLNSAEPSARSRTAVTAAQERVLTDVKVQQTSLSLCTPVSVGGDLERTEGVGFLAELLGLQKVDEVRLLAHVVAWGLMDTGTYA
jgi:hypothetical protein